MFIKSEAGPWREEGRPEHAADELPDPVTRTVAPGASRYHAQNANRRNEKNMSRKKRRRGKKNAENY